MTSDRLAIGAITGAHGVRGQFKVKPFTATPRDIAAYGPVWAGERRLTLSVMGMTAAGLVIVKAAKVTDRDQAVALRGTALEVDRSALPDADGDEIYHADLIGLAVETSDGDGLGRIVALHDFGAGEIVEVRPARGPTLMLPFGPDFVSEIDLAAARVVLTVPEGLLDPPESEGGPQRGEADG